MRVAVVNITGGGLSGGYRKYLENIVPLLQGDSRITGLDIFLPEQAAFLIEKSHHTIHTWASKGLSGGNRLLKSEILKLSPDAVFIPTARWLKVDQIPTVVMVRNMEPLTKPFSGDSLRESLTNLGRAYAAWQACRRSHRIIAVSEHVKYFLVRRWRIPASKIGVVYHGIEPLPSKSEAQQPAALSGKEIEPFIFTAGAIQAHRGLEDVIGALRILLESNRRMMLVIAGEATPGTRPYQKRMERFAKELGVTPQLVWTGQLNSREMAWCFHSCTAFVMTSRIEACPNIALEAMGYGCLCLSINRPPMVEVFNDSAYYYESGDVEGLSDQLIRILSITERERKQRQSLILSRSRHFDWHDTAQRTISEIEIALNPSFSRAKERIS